MKPAPCEERDGEKGEERPKCFPHLYVDEMSAVSPEFKCLVGIDFPARRNAGVLGCAAFEEPGRFKVPTLPLASCGISWHLGRAPSLLCASLRALICKNKGLE